MSENKLVTFIVKTNFAWQVWKETQPDLYWFFEKNFQASFVNLKLTGDEKTFVCEVELPNDQTGRLEKSFKDGSLGTEMDKIHGIDPVVHHGKKDAKLSRFTVTMGQTRGASHSSKKTIEALEEQLLKLEQIERTRSIDLKMVMENLTHFQVEFQKRFDALEKRVDAWESKTDAKCERLEKALNKIRK